MSVDDVSLATLDNRITGFDLTGMDSECEKKQGGSLFVAGAAATTLRSIVVEGTIPNVKLPKGVAAFG
jgi:hypothetical protein